MFKKNYKKIDIVNNLSIKTGFSTNFSKKIIDDFINVLILNIKKGSLNLKNLGSFKVINKGKRMGRNPKTKKEFVIESRKTISFKLSKKISEKVNKIHE